ncbi:hypothetical protein [Roseomonas sp. USHLN139]|uniref:hypothetical protein n=1 Tax=Roseomonas sp. USHLN139 TaxID=3081298 RepID=UPI003B01766A
MLTVSELEDSLRGMLRDAVKAGDGDDRGGAVGVTVAKDWVADVLMVDGPISAEDAGQVSLALSRVQDPTLDSAFWTPGAIDGLAAARGTIEQVVQQIQASAPQ